MWALALLLAVPAAIRTVGLYIHLNSDMEELLPRDSASVRAVEELRRRAPGLQYLGVVVDAGRAENLPAAERLLDDLAARVRAYPDNLVSAVRVSAEAERKLIADHAALFVELGDLKTIRDRLAARKRWGWKAMGWPKGAVAIWCWWRPKRSPRRLHSGRGGRGISHAAPRSWSRLSTWGRLRWRLR